ncbi:MAG: hypothetical protein FJ293_09850 [Planctomycetes bacterium]|nr:hypothetical protein [Planctomycetota bacterium]
MHSTTRPVALATALREDARFLRGLARHLVTDEQLAEDVVQDAWVAVLLKPPRCRRRSRNTWRGWAGRSTSRSSAMRTDDSRRRRARPGGRP